MKGLSSSGAKGLQDLQDLCGMNERNKKIVLEDEETMQHIYLQLKGQDPEVLQYCFGILANLSIQQEYYNYNPKFMEYTVERAAHCLQTLQLMGLLDNILIYISNLCDENESLCLIFLTQDILATLSELAKSFISRGNILTNIYYTINTIFKNSNPPDHIRLQALSIIVLGIPINHTSYDILVTMSTVISPTVQIVQALIQSDVP